MTEEMKSETALSTGVVVNDIMQTAIEEEMRKSYLDYAMSVIVARALPDVRDGLKPVVGSNFNCRIAYKRRRWTGFKPSRTSGNARATITLIA